MAFAAFLTALDTDLSAHSDLSGVTVTTFPQNPDAVNLEGIEVVKVRGGQNWHTMGPNYSDGFGVECRLWARVADDTTEAGLPSRTRAQTMFNAVAAVLASSSSTLQSVCESALISEYEYTPVRQEDSSWRVEVEFTIAVLDLPL